MVHTNNEKYRLVLKSPSLRRRFLEFVDVGDPSQCWEWQGSLQGSGYPQIGVTDDNGKLFVLRANRVSFVLFNGPIPDQAVVRHTCHNPKCVNPAHLIVGSQADNMQDALKAGHLGRKGVLSAAQRAEISRRFVEGGRKTALMRELALEFGISATYVGALVRKADAAV